ncbi:MULTISPECIES: L,D-transpeptidase [Rhodomicrobium]|uniref:L,D-transpeptidase n=1 Tax=Rhodomicrobium TaxID=1068 RepID=UPI000B4BA0C9|nr:MULTISPECIES: L,D-transpeptidase [Rhodomicrobium]
MIDRRAFVFGAPLVLAGCASRGRRELTSIDAGPDRYYLAMYGPVDTEPFPVPAINLRRIDPKFLRREVSYETREAVGTIVVDPNARYAYLVEPGGRAIRYGVGVGREEAFNFKGTAVIARKAEWPRWIPTQDMIKREPDRYGPWAGGMEGGPENPLGPRALYLYAGGRDTYYRLHGTVEPWTIGTMVSSGCVRLMNQDIIDLYERVGVGTKVVVLPVGSDQLAQSRAL